MSASEWILLGCFVLQCILTAVWRKRAIDARRDSLRALVSVVTLRTEREQLRDENASLRAELGHAQVRPS